jgi:hypothetical protein
MLVAKLRENDGIISARLKKVALWHKSSFLKVDRFRLLMNGADYKYTGIDEVLLSWDDRRKIFEKGLYVKTEKRCLLGYDFVCLPMPQSRNCFKSEDLEKLIVPVLAASMNIVARPLFAAFVEEIATTYESDAILGVGMGNDNLSVYLARRIADVFRDEYGDDTFPCRSEEVGHLKQIFKDKVPKVLPTHLVDILRRGGFRNVTQEKEWMYTTQNPSKILLKKILWLSLTKHWQS